MGMGGMCDGGFLGKTGNKKDKKIKKQFYRKQPKFLVGV
jgi:hypothetical protein